MPRVNAGDVELYYESVGDGAPIVFLAHHHLSWMPYQASYFSQHYRVVVFDRRGTGRSASPPGPWTMADLAGDLRGLLDALDIERAIIAGHSLGGAIALQLALDNPGRVRGLAVSSMAHKLWPVALHWFDDAIAAIEEGRPPTAMQPRSSEWEPEGPPSSDPALAGSEGSAFARTLAAGMGRDREAMLNVLGAFRGWGVPEERYAEMGAFTFPSLVMVGGHDSQKTIEYAYELHRLLARSEFALEPDAYHQWQRERPISWNSRVHGFLKRHDLT